MYPIYEATKEDIILNEKASRHVPPHLHDAFEIVYVTQGTVELGVGQELYHMEKGDFAIVFPNVIHHYQVFVAGNNRAYYILAAPALFGMFTEKLQKLCPLNPVINKENLHPDIINALEKISQSELDNIVVKQAYIQVILARAMEAYELVEKECVGSDDIVYRLVAYVAANFRENISLEKMAYDLGVSKYILSRVFSRTFHTNFSQYVNNTRLNYVCAYLENTNRSITEICLDCGFESQRTFNRVFKQKYRMSPREYRNTLELRKSH